MTFVRLTGCALGLALAMLVAGGCKSQTSHDDHKQAAKDRYHQMRARMMLPVAQDQFNAGDLNQAERTVVEALRIDPENAAFYVMAGRIGMERGRLEYGLNAFDKAVELQPGYASAHYYRGLVLQRWQQFENAQQSYERAYELEPDRPSYLLAVAEMLVAQSRPAEALALLESKLVYFEHSAGLRLAVGQLYALTGRPGDAVEMYRQARRLDPNDQRILEELALAELAAGQIDAAVANLQAALAMPANKDRGDLQAALASAYYDAGRYADARALLARLTRNEPENLLAWVQLGKASLADGDTGAALRAAGKVMTLAPHSHEGYLLAGMVWQQRERLDQALPMYEKAAARAPENQTVLLMRGLSLQSAGDRSGAAQVYRQALTLRPEDERIRRLLAQVDSQGH